MNEHRCWRLDGKVAIITGSGRGIGEAIARLFAREGATGAIPETRPPTCEQIRMIREVIDPDGMRKRGFH